MYDNRDRINPPHQVQTTIQSLKRQAFGLHCRRPTGARYWTS
jgi:hypothetical protein